jgi:serine/threonine-protein kinase
MGSNTKNKHTDSQNLPRPGKNKKRGFSGTLLRHLFLASCAFFLAGLLIMITMDRIVMPVMVQSGIELEAPDLIGISLEEAEEIVLEKNFGLLADSTEYNNDFPANTISFQYPSAKTKIKPGRRIRVTVSLGSRPIKMPDLTGKPKRDAELIIDSLGLRLGPQEWVHSNDYLKGIVARQYPEGDQDVSEDSEVILYISDGLPETDIIMPNLIELGLSAAIESLKVYNFDISKINIQTEEAPELLPETVIDQHPDPGTPTNSNIIVDIVVSSPQRK